MGETDSWNVVTDDIQSSGVASHATDGDESTRAEIGFYGNPATRHHHLIITLNQLYNYNDISYINILNNNNIHKDKLIGCKLLLLDEYYNTVVVTNVIDVEKEEYRYELFDSEKESISGAPVISSLYQVSSLESSPLFYVIQDNNEIKLEDGYLNPAISMISSNIETNSDPLNLLLHNNVSEIMKGGYVEPGTYYILILYTFVAISSEFSITASLEHEPQPEPEPEPEP